MRPGPRCARVAGLCIGLLACGTTPEDEPGPDPLGSMAEPAPELDLELRLTPASGTFDLLTYNVAGLPGPIARTDPERCMPLISPLLASYDLVLVQEDFVYHQLLRAQVPHPFQSEPGSNAGAAVNDGLNRFSRYAFEELERVRWAVCHGFHDHASDCTPGAGGSEGDEEARAAGFEQLAEHIAALGPDVPLIVAGDTNLHGGDPLDESVLHAFYERSGLRDACSQLGCPDSRRIDRVLLRSSERVQLEPVEWWLPPEFVDATGRRLSDHSAVAVRVRWTLRAPAD